MKVSELRDILDREISNGRGSSTVVFGEGGAPVKDAAHEYASKVPMKNGSFAPDVLRLKPNTI